MLQFRRMVVYTLTFSPVFSFMYALHSLKILNKIRPHRNNCFVVLDVNAVACFQCHLAPFVPRALKFQVRLPRWTGTLKLITMDNTESSASVLVTSILQYNKRVTLTSV